MATQRTRRRQRRQTRGLITQADVEATLADFVRNAQQAQAGRIAEELISTAAHPEPAPIKSTLQLPPPPVRVPEPSGLRAFSDKVGRIIAAPIQLEQRLLEPEGVTGPVKTLANISRLVGAITLPDRTYLATLMESDLTQDEKRQIRQQAFTERRGALGTFGKVALGGPITPSPTEEALRAKTSLPFGVMGILELAGDPLSYLGGTGAAKTGVKIAAAPAAGRASRTAERAALAATGPEGKLEAMLLESAEKPVKEMGEASYLRQERWNDSAWGLRRLTDRIRQRRSIVPGGADDVESHIVLGSGAQQAGFTRAQLAFNEMKTGVKDIRNADTEINELLLVMHGREVFAAKGANRRFGLFASAQELEQAGLQQVVRLGPAAYGQVQQAAKVVQRIYHEERERMVGQGLMGRRMADELAAKYPWYNPIRYVEYVEEQATKGRNISTDVVSNQVMRLSEEGAEAAIKGPLQVLADQLIKNETLLQRNALHRAVITLAKEDGLPVTKIRNVVPVARVGDDLVFRPKVGHVRGTVSFFENGVRQVYEVPAFIERELLELGRLTPNPVSTFVGAVNGISRAAFTTFNPVFVLSNMAIDTVTAFVSRGILPTETAARIVASIGGMSNKIETSFRLAGGYQQRFYGKSAEQLAKDFGASPGQFFKDAPSMGRRLLEIIPKVGEAGEQASRKALFRRQLDRTLPDWKQMTPEQIATTPQARKAAADAVELTINFARGGYAIKHWNSYILFLNAATEGTKLPFRVLRSNPAARYRLGMIMAGQGGLTAYNLSYPEYADIPNDLRWGAVVVMLPSTEKKLDGTPKANYLALVPRTREWGAALGSTTYVMEQLFRQNPQDFGVYAKTMWPQLIPVSDLPGPEILQEIYGQVANYDLFRREAIVPSELQSVSTAEQVTPWTSRTIQQIANTVGISPLKLQHAAYNLLGGAGRSVTSLTDYMLDQLMPRDVDPRIQALQAQYEAITTPAERRSFRTTLPAEDREALDLALRQPEERLPVISAIGARFAPGRAGQLRRTAERGAEKATGVSPANIEKAQIVLRRDSDASLTRKQGYDTAFESGRIGGETWRNAYKEESIGYQRLLSSLEVEFGIGTKIERDAYYVSIAQQAALMPTVEGRARLLLAGYYSIPLTETAPGEDDFAAFFAKRDEYKASLNVQDRALLDSEIIASRTPLRREYEEGLSQLRPYWTAEQAVLEAMGRPDLAAELRRYKQADSLLKEDMDSLATPRNIFKQVVSATSRVKEKLREKRPDWDVFLIRYGYAAAPKSKPVENAIVNIRNLDVPLESVLVR